MFRRRSIVKLSANDRKRLRCLEREAAEQAARGDGDFIEMGVYLGGSAALLAEVLRKAGSQRTLHLLDSWEGLPPPSAEDSGTIVGAGHFDAASEEAVIEALTQLGLDGHCRTYKGWFSDTLPKVPGPFSLAHVDCDLYEPAVQCLQYVLPRMTPQGVVVVDDYGTQDERRFPGMVKAVAECTAGTDWTLVPLGGLRDQSVKLVRETR